MWSNKALVRALVWVMFVAYTVVVCSSNPMVKPRDHVLYPQREGMCVEKEKRALVRFKRSCSDDYILSWGGEDNNEECCRWMGVECSNTTNHVLSLQLNCEELGTKFPQCSFSDVLITLTDLHHLKMMDLSGCFFEDSKIPRFIGSFEKLEHLILRSSGLIGVIPSQLQNLTKLKTLDLGGNMFLKVNNLDWLYHLPFLSRLDLSDVQIHDLNWLHAISSLHSLKELDLSYCELPNLAQSALHFSLNSSFRSLAKVDLLDNFSSSLVSLDLQGNQLDGHISTHIGNFSLLEYLDMSYNKLNGEVPKSFDKLRNLKLLDLSYNQLVGSLPNFSGLFSLTELHLNNNKLNGSLADTHIGQLSKLEILDVSYNMLNGIISESHLSNLGNLRVMDLSFNSLHLLIATNWLPPFQLQELKLACCRLGPQFPNWIRTQNNISHLDLSSNGILGAVPDWLSNMPPKLIHFNISHNQLSGSFPDLSSIFVTSSTIDISFNKFSGSLPVFQPNSTLLQLSENMFIGPILSICTYVNLGVLDLSNNQFSGELPSCLMNMSTLSILDLSNNRISGNILNILGSPNIIMALVLRNNNLSGELPHLLTNQYLTVLDVGGNHITGKIPMWMGTGLNSLKVLGLRDNKFHGMIPPEICHLSDIQILDLSGNNISGRIPKCFSNFISLAQYDKIPERLMSTRSMTLWNGLYYDMESYVENTLVNWKRKYAEYKGNLRFLKLIDLSNNKLVGNIPKELSLLRGLVSLNLSINQLTGSIDPDIGQIHYLECLDLSRNHLSGEIPTGFVRLTFLSVLDLSNNNLSGSIPSGTQLQGFDASAYAGNNGLCGLPLAPCSVLANHYTLARKNDWLDKGFYICAVFGFVLGFWIIIIVIFFTSSWRYTLYKFWN